MVRGAVRGGVIASPPAAPYLPLLTWEKPVPLTPRLTSAAAALLCWGLSLAPAAAQEDLAGPYLAARHAAFGADYQAAAGYFARALAADPENAELRENAMIANLALGAFDEAATLARAQTAAGQQSRIAPLIVLADNAARGALEEILATTPQEGTLGLLLEGLARGWAALGLGRVEAALEAFDQTARETGMEGFVRYHRALALATAGDYESADAEFAETAGEFLQQSRQGLLARAQVLSQLERGDEARALLDGAFTPDDPEIAAIRTRLEAGEALAFSAVRTPAEGVGEIFANAASAFDREGGESFSLLLARIAQHLAPARADIRLMVGEYLEAQERFGLAADVYASIPPEDPAFYAAEMGRAEALARDGAPEAGAEVLADLAAAFPDVAAVHITHGDMLRRLERFDAASRAYDKALAVLGTPAPPHWPLYYARGITHERKGRWEAAEADFRTALELFPDQPDVLNYLGYSLVEKQIKLDEALSMIERAVEARPEDGHIVDSLGWVLFRLGHFEEAVIEMERAAELMPVDPIVNDHLGDVYWAVGRRLEAQFQWRRALSFEPEEAEAERIRRKLEIGLDAVLAEEGAAPLEGRDGG